VSAVRWGIPAPSHWPRTRVKYVCRFAGGGTPDKGNVEYWNGEILWVSPKDMKSSEIIDTEDHITKAGLDSGAMKLVEAGAVLIVMRSGILRHSIPVAINRVPVTLNQDMRALIPAPVVEPRYLARLIEGHQRQFLNVWSKEGTTVESLESDLVADTEIAVPPLIQQRAIADYLDRETAQLDELVAAKERVLGLLAEKRRALITRAVTRGLDPRTPLHDSGIPWLDEVPAHWRTKRLRWLIRTIEQGWSPEAENRGPNEDE
jgi:type I restriction enzyme, S subunit